MSKRTTMGTQLSNVTDLFGARGRSAPGVDPRAEDVDDESEIAPHEAYSVATPIEGPEEHYRIDGCDGEQTYIFIAVRRGKTLRIREIYPAGLVKKTDVRKIKGNDPKDLELPERPSTIDEAQAVVEGYLFGDLQADDGSNSCGC